jgi:cytochrome c oxidase subunit 4
MTTTTETTRTAAPAQESHEEGHSHAVPLRILAAVWGTLMILTWVTVSATGLDIGHFHLVVALGIAVVKSAYVAMYFMHLRYDRPFNAIIFVTALAFVALFIGLALLDTKEYQPDLIPGYAPAIEASRSSAAH